MNGQSDKNGTADDIKALASRHKRRITERHRSQSGVHAAIPARNSLGGIQLPKFEQTAEVVAPSPVLWPKTDANLPEAEALAEGSVAASIPSLDLGASTRGETVREVEKVAAAPAPKSKPTWLWGTAAAVIAAAVGVGGYLGFGGDETPTATVAPVQVAAPVVAESAPPPAPPAPPVALEEPDLGTVMPAATEEKVAENPEANKAEKAKRVAAAPKKSSVKGNMNHRKITGKKSKAKKFDNSGGDKSIDQLLDEAAGKERIAVIEEAKGAARAKKELARSDVKSAMGKVSGSAAGCYSLYE